MPLLSVSAIQKRFGSAEILSGVDFRVERGEHVALVGANGSGKSTLLRIIAGIETADSGNVAVSRNAIVSYVAQRAEFQSSHTLWEAMIEPFAAALQAQEEMRAIERTVAAGESDAELQERYRRLSARAEHHGYSHESLAERVLTGLELGRESWTKPVGHLSGGQRSRANLARALVEESDLLLLDEPTNHLDIAGLGWLESYLTGQRRAFIIVAHDRYLLDKVSMRTLELVDKKVDDYRAGYAGFLRLRDEHHAREAAAFKRQQDQIVATEEYVRRYGAGQRSKEAKGRQKRLDRVERLARPKSERGLKLNLTASRSHADSTLILRRLAVGYASKPLLTLPDELWVEPGARVAIVGPNGSGKTTLARTLVNQLVPLGGEIRWAPGSSPAYFAQAAEHTFDPTSNPLDVFRNQYPVDEEVARSYLARFLFTGDQVSQLAGSLSGGESSRLALALLLFSRPNILVLDEPTNHLDIPARDALERALDDFAGTLLLVSHDRYLIDRLATEVWAVTDGRLAVFDGNWSSYAAGRNRRTVAYTEPNAGIHTGGQAREGPRHQRSTRANRKTNLQDRDLQQFLDQAASIHQAQAPLLTRLRSQGASAPVDQLVHLTDEYAALHTQMVALTEPLLRPRE